MGMDEKAELPDGFDCECGKHNKYPMYVFAHWRDLLQFECECGRKYEICVGRAREISA